MPKLPENVKKHGQLSLYVKSPERVALLERLLERRPDCRSLSDAVFAALGEYARMKTMLKGGTMLTAEIKMNDEKIAMVEATSLRVISDKPGDFIGDRATIHEHVYCIFNAADAMIKNGTVTHDRRFGWQGLLHKILGESIPIVIETISEEES